MHKGLYYTLFEIYLAYGVTVWGKASKSKLTLILRLDYNPDQKLGQEFFIKEHTKPLFIANHILTLQNLTFYHTCSEIFKKF